MTPYEYFLEIEKPCARIFQSMSNRGISVDLQYLNQLRETLENQKKPIEDSIKNELGAINLNSPKQLIEALNEKGIYPTLKGKPSTDKRALERLREIRVVTSLLQFSQLETLLSSFVYPYLERNQSVVHPFFNQCGTRTGRLSCSNPNLLQIPKHTENGKLVRKMFTARPGMLLGDCDFAAIEPRVMAHLSKDPNMCRMFNDGLDFHQFTADNLGISRDRAKVLNLSVGYRATFKSVSQQLKCGDKEAQDEIDKWWSLFPSLRRWQESLIYESKRSGFCTTLMGRRIRIDDLNHGNSWRREGSERQLINNITQGSAAEIMKLAMLNVDNMNKNMRYGFPDFGLLVQVYDELLWECSNTVGAMPIVKMLMETCIKLDVPLVVDAKSGPNWGEVQ
jgi:DNA polymerase-1